jgi:hypothetical protein
MSVVPSKYRGTPAYFFAFKELLEAARFRGTVTYQQIAAVTGLPPRGSYMGAQVGYLLGEISDDEHAAGRPMLSALCVSVTGIPGPGFYVLASQLGLLPSDEEDRAFWEAERERVYTAWKPLVYVPRKPEQG